MESLPIAKSGEIEIDEESLLEVPRKDKQKLEEEREESSEHPTPVKKDIDTSNILI